MLHYFNPDHERAVLADNEHYTLATHSEKMKEDLSFLPAWYASSGDFVFVSPDFDIGFREKLPCKPQGEAVREQDLEKRKNELSGSGFIPWGTSPDVLKRFENLNDKYGLHLSIGKWDRRFIEACGRKTASACLSDLSEQIPEIQKDILPIIAESEKEIENYLQGQKSTIIIKSPYSSSGRGLQWISPEGYDRSRRQIVHGYLKKQGYVCMEKALDKICDFSMLFFSSGKNRVHFKGYSVFTTDTKGNYSGNRISTQASLFESLISQGVNPGILLTIKDKMEKILAGKYKNYKGALGVDMMLYKDTCGKIRIHPCLEINMRFSMGWPAMKIANLLGEKSSGRFYILYKKEKGEICKENILRKEKYPLILENSKIISGYMPLCPIGENTHFNAYIIIDHE